MLGFYCFFAHNLVYQKFIIFHRQDTHQAILTDVHIKELQDVGLNTSWNLKVKLMVIRFENVKALVIVITSHQVAVQFLRILIEVNVLNLA